MVEPGRHGTDAGLVERFDHGFGATRRAEVDVGHLPHRQGVAHGAADQPRFGKRQQDHAKRRVDKERRRRDPSGRLRLLTSTR